MIVDNSHLDAFINKKKSFHMAFVGNKKEIIIEKIRT